MAAGPSTVTTTQPSASINCTAAAAAFACSLTELGDDELLVSRELEEIAAASRRQHEPHYASTSFFDHRGAAAAIPAGSSGTGCEVCGRGGGGGGFNSPVSTAPLAASGGGGGSGLIAAPAPASWCLYCGCTQSGGGTATAVGPGQCSQCSPHRRAVQTLQRQPPSSEQHRGLHRTGRGYYEAEDASAKYQDGGARNRSGQYYSPPGTSYTIVETSTGSRPTGRDVPLREIGFRPITASNRASSQSPPGSHPRHRGKHHMGAPSISPEQVIRMLNSNHHPGAGKHHPHHLRHETHPPGGTTVNSIPQPSTAIANLPVRTVSMVRPHDAAHGFGICVKGGRDSGVGVYISRVEENSVAEHVGLRAGDSILEVNGMPFGGVSHDEALKMLKSCRRITMTVRSGSCGSAPYPLPPPPGTSTSLPPASTSTASSQLYTWTDRHGRPVSPPPEYAAAASGPPPLPPPQSAGTAAPRQWNYCSARSKDRTRKVELSIEPGQSLGLMIRGGIEYGLGIFVTGVDLGSVAERSGLMIGDQILEVNGQSFLAVTHDEAVGQLKYHKRMSLVVRDVGKVPSSGAAPTHAASSLHSGAWETHLPHTARSPAGWQRGGVPTDSAGAALQMVQEKARVVLPHPEFASLDYYQREYAARQMDVEAFVAVLLEMLNTSEKYTLLTEIREVVRPEDRTRFDELVYRREAEGQRCRELRDLLGHRGAEHLTTACARERAPTHRGHASHCTSATCGATVIAGSAGSPVRFALPPGSGGEAYVETKDNNLRSPSEDSGVDCAGHGCWGSRGGGCESPPMTHRPMQHYHGACCVHQQPHRAPLRTSDLGLSTDEAEQQQQQDYRSPGDRSRRHSSPGADQDGPEGGGGGGGNPGQYDDANMSGYLDGLRSSIGGLTQRVKSWYWGRPIELAQKLSRSFDMSGGGGDCGDQQGLLVDGECSGGSSSGPPRRRTSMQRVSRGGCGDLPELAEDGMGALVVPDLQGNLRITVKKCKPMLGIAIEGGANTKHPLPRIINIHENGAAYEAGGLEVGQLILEVDGHKVEGMHHQDVARLIAESFAARGRQEIEFLVVEAKKSNLEAKPTALIFLEA